MAIGSNKDSEIVPYRRAQCTQSGSQLTETAILGGEMRISA